jgi:hypothetical protein
MKTFEIGDKVQIKTDKTKQIYEVDNVWLDYRQKTPHTTAEYTLIVNGVEQNFSAKQLIKLNS